MKIRIAVAMDEEGNFSSAGWKGASDEQMSDTAREGIDYSDYIRVTWVTAEVEGPVPDAEAVGEVER